MIYFRAILLLILLSIPSELWAQRGGGGPTPVFVAPVERGEFVDEIEALGTLQANENVDLTSTVTERVTAIHFTDNQRVKAGDILVEMDAAEEEAEMTEEQSNIDEAQRQLNRLTPLVERGAASTSILDTQKRDLATAEARIKAIKSRINERRVIAPFDGVVGIRDISVGALAQPGTVITTIDDDSIMKLDFSIPEVFLAALKPGIEIEARTIAYPNRVFKGTISSINSRVDPVTRAIQARAVLDNQDGALKAGMLMRVMLKKNPRQALIIPEEALIIAGTQQTVMVADQDAEGKMIARRQAVTIGARRKGDVEILEGLNEGEQIITHGTLKVRPGAEINIRAIETNDETLGELLNQQKKK